jgi:trans-2-enoyl-CoA reductase
MRQDKQNHLLIPIDTFFKSIAATVKTFYRYHQNICKSRIFAILSEVEMTEILQETKSTHSSEYSSASPDERL